MSRKVLFLLVLFFFGALFVVGPGVQPASADAPVPLYAQDFNSPDTQAILDEGWYAQADGRPVDVAGSDCVGPHAGVENARGYHTCPAPDDTDRAFGFYKTNPTNNSFIRFTYTAPAQVTGLSIQFDWESTWSRFDSGTSRKVAMRGPTTSGTQSMGYKVGAASVVNFSPTSFPGGVQGTNSLITSATAGQWLTDAQMTAANLRKPGITHDFSGVTLNACDTFVVYWYGTTNISGDQHMQNNIDNFALYGSLTPAAAALDVSVDPEPSEFKQQTALQVDFSVSGLCAPADGVLDFTVDGVPVGQQSVVGNDLYSVNYTFTAWGDYEICVAYTPENALIQAPAAPTCVTHTVKMPPPLGDALYLSSSANGRMRGTNIYDQSWDFEYQDEDVLYYDGYVWSLVFDGSNYGLASNDVDAFALGPNGTYLLSLESSFNAPSGPTESSDILQFDPAAGSFSLFFDGSDRGLNSADENIDAFEWVDDGSQWGLLYISTTGTPYIGSPSGLADEDILLFTPTSLGANTAGQWSRYLDGSAAGVKLSQTVTEDTDDLAFGAGARLYLGTLGNFGVGAVSGTGADVFTGVYNSAASMTYDSALFFSGAAAGLVGAVDAFDVP